MIVLKELLSASSILRPHLTNPRPCLTEENQRWWFSETVIWRESTDVQEGFSPGKKDSACGELKTGCNDNQIQSDSLNYLQFERLIEEMHIQFSLSFLFFHLLHVHACVAMNDKRSLFPLVSQRIKNISSWLEILTAAWIFALRLHHRKQDLSASRRIDETWHWSDCQKLYC